MNGRGPLVAGVVLIAIGALLLVREYIPAIAWSTVWPWASIVLGVVLIILSVRRRPEA
jgi:uncharacterized membrane protein HdeD (DUF308 family)